MSKTPANYCTDTPAASMRHRIAGMPKAELHMHLEGSLEADLMFRLSRRNKVALRWSSEEELRSAYKF